MEEGTPKDEKNDVEKEARLAQVLGGMIELLKEESVVKAAELLYKYLEQQNLEQQKGLTASETLREKNLEIKNIIESNPTVKSYNDLKIKQRMFFN